MFSHIEKIFVIRNQYAYVTLPTQLRITSGEKKMTGDKTRGSTSICGFTADEIEIRGKNLVTDFIGEMDFVSAFLFQSLGKKPTAVQVELINTVMVTIMEHGLVPSAIVSRLTHYGAPESYQGAIAAGLLGVGDRYAGTSSACGHLLERMHAADDPKAEASAIIREHRAQKRPLPGFGHPIHKDTDPRVERLLSIAENSGSSGEYLTLMRLLETTLCEETGKTLVTNISAAIGAVLAEAGIPAYMMRGIVLTARCAGLVGHLAEEMNNPAAPAMWQGAQDAVDYKAN
jgi:citrate synthase